MSYEFILSDRVEGAAIITLNRPEKLNALSFALSKELDDELRALEDDAAVSAVILTGAGERAFSAGADIHEMSDMSSEVLAEHQAVRNQTFWYLANYPKPIIGAINGLAFGGGALLSSTLDIRIGCERSSFRFLAASYGRVNSSWSLPTLIGLPKAKELLYTGREVKADEAERIGLLNQVVPAADLLSTAIDMAQLMAKNDARMVQGLKRLLTEGIGMGYSERYHNEEEARETWLLAGHPREGFKDFLSRKRQAK
jgi:enoyl-CoA hydratase